MGGVSSTGRRPLAFLPAETLPVTILLRAAVDLAGPSTVACVRRHGANVERRVRGFDQDGPNGVRFFDSARQMWSGTQVAQQVPVWAVVELLDLGEAGWAVLVVQPRWPMPGLFVTMVGVVGCSTGWNWSVAERVDVVWVDDLDGSAASESVVFGLDGHRYEIDLSGENAAVFRRVLAPFVAGARRRPRAVEGRSSDRGRAGKPAPDPADRAAVRRWARANGFEVAERGRVPEVVMSAYRQRRGAVAARDVMESSPTSGLVASRVASPGQPVGTGRGGVEESMTGSASVPEEQPAPMAASPFTAVAPAVVSQKQGPLVADPFRFTPPSSS